MLYTDWFKTNFENFAKEKEKFVPAFGLSYRIRDPNSIPDNLPVTYDLSEDSDIGNIFYNNREDLVFADSLRDDLVEISGKNGNKYDFKLELITIPLEESNDFWNFIYAYFRMTEDFYNKNRNISKPNSPMSIAINSIITSNTFSHKRPTEIGFNYNKKGERHENSVGVSRSAAFGRDRSRGSGLVRLQGI